MNNSERIENPPEQGSKTPEYYTFNKGKLTETNFAQLPLGSVKAESWLLQQMLYQKSGITGHMEEYDDYSMNSGWLGGSGEDWERGPYYTRGLIALAYTLDDAGLKEKARKWIDRSLESQISSGFWGPSGNSDWWPRMPMMMAIRDYYEATGKTDARVILFFEKYFRYQFEVLPQKPLSDWGKARGGDNLDSIYWYYNQVYDESSPQETDWLLDLALLIRNQTDDWTDEFTNTTVRKHVVNTSQALKMPVVYYQQSKSEKDRDAFWKAVFNWNIDHGRIDGLPNSDEAARDNESTRGSELCGIVENMLSTEIAMRITGDAKYGDYLEKIAYNSLPNGFTYDLSGHTYFILQNQVMATMGYHGFDCDHGDSSAFGAPNGFDCCFANGHMGWPKFVQNMWMAVSGGGLAVTAYGPNNVTAIVTGGKTAVFESKTDYPFRENIRLLYKGEEASFPLLLRIPGWCGSPSVKINGRTEQNVKSGEYFKIERTFTKGDMIEISFPPEIKTSTWYNNSVAVQRGPLIYSLKIEEDWRIYEGNSARELKTEQKTFSPSREVYPAGPWNYGLVINEEDTAFTVIENEIGIQPFYNQTPPVTIKAMGQLIPEWTLDGNKAASQPFGPVVPEKSLQKEIELIPYGSGRLKITHFPKIGKRNDSQNDLLLPDCSGRSFEFKNVVVPYGENYSMDINYTGGGLLSLIINGKNTGDVKFADSENAVLTVTKLRDKIDGEAFKFKDGHYNNICFSGGGNIIIHSIKITVEGAAEIPIAPAGENADFVVLNAGMLPEDKKIHIIDIKGTGAFECVQLEFPKISEALYYKILVGHQPNIYTAEINGIKFNPYKNSVCFDSDKFTVGGLENGKIYYFRMIAMDENGEIARSNELAVRSGCGEISSYLT